MKATVSVALHNRSDMTRQFIAHMEKTIGKAKDIEFIFSDNASSDDTVQLVASSTLPHKTLIRYGINTGFGYPHREALKLAKGIFFIVLNNDIFIEDANWLDTLLAPLADKQIAIVGVEGNPCSLKPDGHGYPGRSKEYVEGSIMAGRTELFKQKGFFSPAYKKYYYEDSDLGLRYRQMGYKLAHVPIKHVHHRSSTARIVQDPQKLEIVQHNGAVFMKRWGRYLQNRSFSNNILVRMNSLGAGDILAATPAISGIRADHPMAKIELDVSHPEIFRHNPHINDVFRPDRKHTIGYDRIVDIRPNYQLLELISSQAEEMCATSVGSHRPQIFLQQSELEEAARILAPLKEEKDVIIAFNPLMSRIEWQGRNWNIEEATRLAQMLKDFNSNIGIVEIGHGTPSTDEAHIDLVGDTTMRGLFAIMAQVDFFIGIDSLPLHVAQAFDLRSYILFGATEPIARVIDFTKTIPIRNEGLVCLGCYHKPGAHPINKCGLGTEACMRSITAEYVMEYIAEANVNPLEENCRYLQGKLRGDDEA